jgi:hypothetical protein
MDHHEGQGEVNLGIDAEAILFALDSLDAVSHARLFCPSPQYLQHLLLKIDGDHPALVTNQLRHRDREKPHPAANVHHGHPRLDVGADDLIRVVEKAANRIVYEVAAPPGQT